MKNLEHLKKTKNMRAKKNKKRQRAQKARTLKTRVQAVIRKQLKEKHQHETATNDKSEIMKEKIHD